MDTNQTHLNYKQREDGMIYFAGAYRSYASVMEQKGDPNRIEWFNGWEGYLKDVTTKKRRNLNKPYLVYVLHDPRKPGWSKVGIAARDGNRIFQYLTSDPYREIKAVKTWEFSNREKASNIEKVIGNILSEEKNYEWYSLDVDDLVSMVEMAVEDYGES